MTKARKYRCLSALLAIIMTIQPVMPVIAAATDSSATEEVLVKAKMFPRANDAEALAFARLWGRYLDSFSQHETALRSHVLLEEQLATRMMDQLKAWEDVCGKLQVPTNSVERLQAIGKLRALLATSLDQRRTTAHELTDTLNQITDGLAGLRQNHAGKPDIFVAAYRFETDAQLLESLASLTDRLWNTVVLVHAQLADQFKMADADRTSFFAISPELAQLLSDAATDATGWMEARTAVAKAAAEPLKPINMDREAVLLNATLKLADAVGTRLKDRTDADSKAHSAMVRRYRAVVERNAERLTSLGDKSLEGLPEESFVALPTSEWLSGPWSEFAAKQEAVIKQLIANLDQHVSALAAAQAAVSGSINDVERLVAAAKSMPQDNNNPLTAIGEGLKAGQGDIANTQGSLNKLANEIDRLITQLGGDRAGVFRNPDLKSSEKAAAYQRLGQIVELSEALTHDFRVQLGAVIALSEAANLQGAKLSLVDVQSKQSQLEQIAGQFEALRLKDQDVLTQYRRLCVDVLGMFRTETKEFSGKFSGELQKNQKSQYFELVKQMSQRLERNAEVVDGLTEPVLQAVAGAKPELRTPELTWIGTSTLGGSLRRMIERGAYFRSVGLEHVKSLLEDAKGFANSLNIVDLAISVDFPVRTFVAPDGMALVIGVDRPAVVIRGIGNLDQYHLNPNAPRAAIPDFMLGGVAIGGDWWGDFTNWCGDVGKGASDFVGGVGKAVGDAANSVVQFGAQVVDTVGKAQQIINEKAVEVGGFLWDSACTLGSDILNDPGKLAEYICYGAALVFTGALTVATGGAAAPLFLATAKYVGTNVAIDYGKAMAKTANKRGWIDEKTATGLILVADVGQLLWDAKSVVKNLANLPKSVGGISTIVGGATPRWTVGLIKPLRDLATTGEISWNLARQLQYAGVAFRSFNAVKTFAWSLPKDLINFLSADNGYVLDLLTGQTPQLPSNVPSPATPQPGNNKGTSSFTPGGGSASGGGGGGAGPANTSGTSRNPNYEKLSK